MLFMQIRASPFVANLTQLRTKIIITDNIDAVIVVRTEGEAKFPNVPSVEKSTVAANTACNASRKTVTANTAAITTATLNNNV